MGGEGEVGVRLPRRRGYIGEDGIGEDRAPKGGNQGRGGARSGGDDMVVVTLRTLFGWAIAF